MIGYTPAEQAIRASQGKPPDTGADPPPAWHLYDARAIKLTGASGAGQPGNPMQPSEQAETDLLHMKAAS